MCLFRSEEHLDAWLAARGLPRGGAMTSAQGLELGRRWYEGRLSPDWRPVAPATKAAIFRAVGLTGPFWDLGVTE